MAYIDAKEIKKSYKVGQIEINALNGVDFTINKGEFVVILGPSGAGKTTLLNILGGMDELTSGSIIIDEVIINKKKEKTLTQYRREDVGFVFQNYNLIQNLTALENVELATQISPNAKRPKDVLKIVGLSDRMNNFPAQLSGGEQQRVAIARAVAKNPKLLLCDEPTGALDTNTGKTVLLLLKQLAKEEQMTVIVITHNQVIAELADRVIRIVNGKVFSQVTQEPKDIKDIAW
ncbi:ABC transporter, ATP-binding protein [Alteracholeplasma palmae J233]|uniref:ABC transporter, ATP-binding protein n=1 Tax=Alteracholeplasma palmae (strain ATCC 49389 / J233) TaxID=1318466 RepID=U4KL69_ALTPJ|nr:ABC transporter ATP-binding protein [Alteracholeplasma palmae]CCV64493.1 ABC transporter, ATP-binding protein [Alteracholeplasma palmae J233]